MTEADQVNANKRELQLVGKDPYFISRLGIYAVRLH